MFDYSNMIKRAIKYFPIWSDIRKRNTKSIGGQLIDSALKETLELNNAIQEYKDFYFIDRYEGKEDTVLTYVYAANIGMMDNLDFKVYYNEKEYICTNDINEFIENNYLSYYENGLIYLHTEQVDLNTSNKLTIDIDNHKYSYDLELTHVWNIFDEFACFVGLQRHENEDNVSLKDRILYATKNPGNNTEEGLKNSIVTELMSFIDISKDDIKINRVTPKSLTKAYKEYNSLLDMLSTINRDVIKDKKWDLDKWEYDFKSISFLDNVWDSAVSSYQNGIGFEDDLKVIIADNETTTDADIVLYDKSTIKLEKYVADKHIKKDIKFKLKRFENILNPINAKYTIKASEAIDITNEDIELSVYENNERRETRKIEEIYKIGEGIVAVDNSKITDENPYRLEFYSNNNQDSMKISKIRVIYKHKSTGEITEVKDLLKPAPGFTLNASGELVNTSIKRNVRSINHFNQSEGLIDKYNEGIVLAPNRNEGKGVLDVTGLGLNLVDIDIFNQSVDIPKSIIKNNAYCFWREEELVFRYDVNQERKFEIETDANFISFKVLEGDADLFYEYNGEAKYEKIKASNKDIVIGDIKALSPQRIKVTVISNMPQTVRFSDFKYCNHTVDLSLQYGQLISDSEGLRLPNFPNNSLVITMSSKTSSSPILKHIYIGKDIHKLVYKTEIFNSKPNTNRIIEITTNSSVNLHHVDSVGNVISTIKDYVPATSYKATKDNAWIRLNTDEYDSINEITSTIGATHIIEESGKLYYNIVLKMGQSISTVVIDGVRNIPAKTITLEKMIKSYFPEFNMEEDKVYASKLCKGLIVSDNDEENPRVLIINIKSNIFSGVDSSYYKFTKLPETLSVVFNSSSTEVHNKETNLPFESITFVPGGTKIYQAINEAKIFTGEMRNIEILNNFSPILNSSDLMYYEVEPFKTDYEYSVKFCTDLDDSKSFEDLLNWSLGRKKIAIKTPIDLSNTDNYEITNIDIVDEVLLSRHVELKKSYKLGDNREIFTNRYMVIPEDGSVLYERYSESHNDDLIIQEELIMEEDGFTKLEYSNIDDILYIGFNPYSGSNEEQMSEYQLLKEEGIILWTNQEYINAAKKVYIRYIIKNPIAILLDEDYLYKAIGYNVDAYNEINRFKLAGVTDGYRFDLKNVEHFEKADMVYTSCSSSSFQADGFENIVTFKKVANKDTILVKTGYYYINGKEYYLFPSKDEIVLDEEKYIEAENVEISGDEITLRKRTDNYIRNSELLFRGINELYNFDASKSKLKGVSTLNSITSCDSFNHWHTFGMKMILKDGLNDLGIHFMPEITNGYAYLDITEYLTAKENYLSFWADKTLQVYIGEEKKYLDLNFPDCINIKISHEISYKNSLIRSTVIEKEENKKYYLIVKNTGTIDDIILNESEESMSLHTKNINLLGLKINEGYKQGQKYRMFLNSNKDIVNKGASITKDGYIKTASNMYWGLSPLKTYNTKEDFSTCHTENLHFENDYLKTTKSEGILETPPIFIENTMTIKRIIVKINEINFDNMRGMKIHILSSNTRDGEYIPMNIFNDNYGYAYGDSLLKYIKIKVVIPDNKYLNNLNVYVEYKSTEANAPKVLMPSSGEVVSKVFDAQYSSNYKIRDINLEDISNINDVLIQVRASKEDYSADVWQPWKTLEIKDLLSLKNEVKFFDTRFFQVKVLLKTSSAYVKINNIDIEVI